ncbi:MAG: sigma-54-dependent transcriptional regulator [Planctomycetota bacterium]|jgi:DNA-binding NtrC family response regulator
MNEDRPRILVVDDDAIVATSIAAVLEQASYRAEAVETGERALARLEEAETLRPDRRADPFAVAVLDMTLPGICGLELIKRLRDRHPDVVPIAITGYGTIESAVKAIRHGAIDYLTKPLVDEELLLVVQKAVQQHTLRAENLSLRRQLDQRYGLDSIVGSDPRMQRIFDTIDAVAASRTTVLMSGDSGTGKSLIARAIHRQSPRAEKPFVEISCGSIPETLLESELFGHVQGAFTGAHTDKPGRFLAADGGTLFLDEINSASPGMQLKLLRVLQERTFEPVGSAEPVEVDVRVILASNQPLEELVAGGTFRQDLYYRINVVMVEVPPLRDRVGDIPLLAEHFLQEKCREANKRMAGFSDETMTVLCKYAYPGNVRELENIVERAVVLTRGTRIGLTDLPPHVVENEPRRLSRREADVKPGMVPTPYEPKPLREALEEPEKQILLAALEANDWNRQRTAEVLQINRTTLYKKIKQYGLERYGRAG